MKFPNEPFDWERRYADCAYRVEKEFTDTTATALTAAGMKPHVEYVAGNDTDILWWDGSLTLTQMVLVQQAHDFAKGPS